MQSETAGALSCFPRLDLCCTPSLKATHSPRKVLRFTFEKPMVRLRQETSTAEQPKKAQRTEQQADDKVTDIKDNAEAAGEGVDIEKQGSEIRVTKQSGEQIYIGFDKGDKDRSKPGRVISDDPSRYPDRTQTTGGWSGGEKGLAAFIEVKLLASKIPASICKMLPSTGNSRSIMWKYNLSVQKQAPNKDTDCTMLSCSACNPSRQQHVAMLVHLEIANLRLLLQEEQQKMSASKAVVPEDQREAQKAGNKPTVVSKDGDTIYLGFDKG